MKTKKILSVVLAILMLIGTFAVGASAAEQELKNTDVILAGEIISGTEESYWLTVDGALTADGASAENYNIRISASYNQPARITFNNVQLSVTSAFESNRYVALGTQCDTYIYLQGKNKIDVMPGEFSEVYGIYSTSNITIHGEGSLEMNIGNKNTLSATGILGDTVDITGSTSATLNMSSVYIIKGCHSGHSSSASDNANIVINEKFLRNKEIEAMEGYDQSELAEGIKAIGYAVESEGLCLSDNAKVTVNMINTDSVANINQGFDIEDNLELWNNSHITVNGTDGSACAGIIMNNGDLTVKGTSSINVKAGNADEGVSYGIYLYNGQSNKQYVTLTDSAKISATSGNADEESLGFFAYAELTASDSADLNAISGATLEGDSYGIMISRGAILSGNAQLKGVSGDVGGESHGVYLYDCLTVSDNSVVEGRAGNAKEKSVGITAEGELLVNGKAKIIAESKNSEIMYTLALETESLKAYDDVQINAKAGDGVTSAGVYAGQSVIYGNAKITAESGNGTQASYGFIAEDNGIIITENATLTAVSNEAVLSNGIIVLGEFKVSGNAVVDAKAVNGTVQCIGVFTEGYFLATGNANIKAIGSTDAEYSVGLAAIEMDIQNASTIEASGYMTALYAAEEDYKITGYENGYIVASTDTNPENAVEYTNEHPLVLTGTDEERTEDGYYKYVFIASEEPEPPAEPEPELNFFEQLIADIVDFFNRIITFFSSLFSFLG